MHWLLILWISGVPHMHEFATQAQCEQVRKYAVKHETRVLEMENHHRVVQHGITDSACIHVED